MSDSTQANESITEILPFTLGKYLMDKVQGIKEFYDEFPNASVAFKMPSVSVVTSNFKFSPAMVPYKVKPVEVSSITNSKAKVLWVVGDYNVNIQLDIWAGSKEERDDLYDATLNVLNPKISPMGLTLKLNDYFGVLCDYLYVSHEFADSEQRSQRDEWRTTMTLLATCKAIRDRKEFIIETTELDADATTEPLE